MDYWLINNLLTLGLAILLTGIIIPKILTIAFRKNLFDKVDARKIHHGAIPRLGGIAFVPSIIFAVLLTVGIGLKFNSEAMLKVLGPAIVPVLFLVCALMLLFLIGIADDLIGVSYNSKFAVQILCAVLMLVSGVRIDNLYGFLGLHELPLWLSYLGTALLVVFIVNAINLIDGIDGLCSGLSAICLFCYGTLFILTGQYLYSMISWATFGCLVPFFYFNIFGDVNRRRKIFMGDTGSLTIGMVLVFLSVEATRVGIHVPMLEGVNPLIVAYAPLMLPMFDVVRVFNHRIQKHRNPFTPDKCHIHHKLMAMGIVPRKTLAVILLVTTVWLVFNIVLSPYVNVNLLVGGDVAIWIIANLLLTHVIRNREKRLNRELYD